jgi:hypothetical protein
MHLFTHSYNYNCSYLLILLKPESWAFTENQECTVQLKLYLIQFFCCFNFIHFLRILLFTVKESNNQLIKTKKCVAFHSTFGLVRCN